MQQPQPDNDDNTDECWVEDDDDRPPLSGWDRHSLGAAVAVDRSSEDRGVGFRMS